MNFSLKKGKNYHFYVTTGNNKTFHYHGKLMSISGKLLEIYDYKIKDIIIISELDIKSIRPSRGESFD